MPTSSPLLLPLLDALDGPALLIDRSVVIAANAAAQALLGQEIVGRDVRLAIRHPQALDAIGARMPPFDPIEIVGIGSSDRPWTLKVSPLGGQVRLVALNDRSAQVTADRMRTDFVANASHELKTPLATVLGYAETLAEDGPLDDAMRRRFGATILSEARRMQRIIDDLMSLSRIEAERYRRPVETVDLGAIARLAVDNARFQAEECGAEVETKVAPGVPTIDGDHGQLLQMADNLVGNALRYGCAGQSKRVRVSVDLHGGQVRLTVSDDGEGVAIEHLPRLTERFYRVDDARGRKTGGTGLGLAIVKHIVERHRGTLLLESQRGRGTKVTVLLPLRTA